MRHDFANATALATTLALSACGIDPVIPANMPPAVTFEAPTAGMSFAGGDNVLVQIAATDDQDGSLPDASITWWADLHHEQHTHPFIQPSPGSTGTVSIPRVGHLETNIFYRIYAVAIDSEGLTDTAFVDIGPRIVTITIETIPTGLEVTVDGQPRTAPYAMESVVGMERDVGATTPQSTNTASYDFASWSDGGSATRTYTVPPAATTLTATFTEIGGPNVSPTVVITSPPDGSTVTAGTQITIAADATDPDGGVATVAFFDGTTAIGTDDTAPYSVPWTPSGVGARSLTARATDNQGASTTSPVVAVTVQATGPGDVIAPVATLTTPTQGSLNLTGSVSVTADATDDVGVTQVEFQVDGATIGTDDAAPFTATLAATSDYTTGAHTVRVRARDAAGNWSPWSAATVTFGGNVDLPAGFTQEVFASGFGGRLTAGAFAPDGRLFALEQAGRVRVVPAGGTLLVTPFLTLSVRDEGERGLLGIAFDPGFTTNGYIYLYYTTDQGGTVRNRISRFTAVNNVAVPNSEVVLVELDPLSGATNHNGGAMAFGADGKLYVAVGDNANSAQAQSLTTRHGKMLRYNPDGSIPADNPLLATTSGVNQAIWALGLRNPFTFDVQPGSGRIHINDVGQNTWEEINLGRPGANYGWPNTEGPTTNPAFDGPILAYRHSSSPTLFTGGAIVGAAFYNPAANTFGAAYEGDYFFADYTTNWIYRLDSDNWDTAYAFARPGSAATNLLIGEDGALYVFVGSRIDRIRR